MFHIAIITVLLCVWCATGALAASPYPESPAIDEIRFDWSTHRRLAPGSDNWPMTWAQNGHQYTSWGDGGGFGGTNSQGRDSLGFARVEGTSTNYKGVNVWGGVGASNPPPPSGGKSYGMLALGDTLYAWVSPGSATANYDYTRLHRSTNGGRNWTAASWRFLESDRVILPTILQFGRGYAGARDDYVYTYAPRLKNASSLRVQVPGEIDLMRVPRGSIMTRNAYQFFDGLNSDGSPRWTATLANREPVFRDPAGVGWTVSVSYNPGLRRYLLITEHSTTSVSRIGIFDAPQPWGPWTTVLYASSFGAGEIEQTGFFWNFANKWLSADGKQFTMVFTGVDDNDSWNSIRGEFVTSQPPTELQPPGQLHVSSSE